MKKRIGIIGHAGVGKVVLVNNNNKAIPVVDILKSVSSIKIVNTHIPLVELPRPTKKQQKNFRKNEIKKGWKRK